MFELCRFRIYNYEGGELKTMLDENSVIQILAPIAIIIVTIFSGEWLLGVVALLLLRILHELIRIRILLG